jgi:sodium pump decarboxylase gamma subunit
MTLLERFADPSIIHSMSFGEKMMASGYVAILGMGITFIALVILWVAIAIMSRVIAGFENKKSEVKIVKAPVKADPNPALAEVHVSEADDLELVAVLTAAIAAATQQPINQIFVRNIRRVEGNLPAWQRAGISKQVAKRM